MSTKVQTHPERSPQEERGHAPAFEDVGPSLLSEGMPTFPRVVGLLAAILVILCGAFLAYNLYNPTAPGKFFFPTGWLVVGLELGLLGLLFHAICDSDVQFRRLYLIFGGAAFIVGVFLCLVPNPKMGDQFRSGFPCMVLALLFVLAALRNETDAKLRNIMQQAMGMIGAALFLTGVVGGNINEQVFLVPHGLLLGILGVFYIAGFVASRGIDDNLAYKSGWGLGAAGLLTFLVAFARSTPALVYNLGWRTTPPPPYLVPFGLLLMLVGVTAMAVAVLLVSENRVVIMIRRELASLFLSPVAYFVLIGFALMTWIGFMLWFWAMPLREPQPEPIVNGIVLQWPGVLMMLFGVPVLTMGLLSEEKRTGTLEVLMTTPTDEPAVVLSKFVAGLLLFLTMWTPFGLFVLAFRIMGGAPFDYLPLLSFGVALTVSGAAFTAAGLFFSSITPNQIVSAVLTFVFMMAMTFIFLIPMMQGRRILPLPEWIKPDILKGFIGHISYIDLWITSFNGKLSVAPLLFFVSMTAWFLFASVKVLEARKWS
jgi:ABC-type transport system involved in multi-copper enzyme maturation permease subunit